MTYETIATKVGLDEKTTKRYCKYMRTRWEGEEQNHCKLSYATQWANRFKSKTEYCSADSTGQEILKKIDSGVI